MERLTLFASRQTRANALRAVAVVAGVAVLSVLALWLVAPGLTDPVAFRAFVLGYGPLAPAVFVLLQAGQVVVAPIPGQLTGVAAGYLFGALAGTAYSLAGIVLGSTVVFALSRRFGRPYVERVVAPDALARFDDLVDGSGRLGVLAVFVVPGLPDDAVCFVAGLTDIPLWQLVVIAAVGRLPTVFLMALVGAQVADARLLDAATVALAVVALSIVGYRFRDRLVGALGARHSKPP